METWSRRRGKCNIERALYQTIQATIGGIVFAGMLVGAMGKYKIKTICLIVQSAWGFICDKLGK